jgi:hypothetical protein
MTEFMPDENVLPDDYPVYGDYFYLADGKVYRSDWHDVTVRYLKAKEGFKEVRRCNWRRFNGTNAQIHALSSAQSTEPQS